MQEHLNKIRDIAFKMQTLGYSFNHTGNFIVGDNLEAWSAEIIKGLQAIHEEHLKELNHWCNPATFDQNSLNVLNGVLAGIEINENSPERSEL